MKFISFLKNNQPALGIIHSGRVFDLDNCTQTNHKSLQQLSGKQPYATMHSLLEYFNVNGGAVFEPIQKCLDSDRLGQLEADLEILAPLPSPRSLRDGYAFRQHVATMRKNRGAEMIPEFDQFPVFYHSNHNSCSGPGDIFVQQKHLEKLDYELEAAVVIGKEGINIKASEADEHIFGLCIWNDFSARAMQMQEMKMSLGPAKGKDFANSFGPYLVTKDSLKDKIEKTPQGNQYHLEMRAWVNDRKLSVGQLGTMDWTFAQIIERISYGNRVYPGEIIGSGTVGTGCLAELNSSKVTDNLWLQPGDKVALEIDELGRLENTIVLTQES